MRIIEIAVLENGAHKNQTGSFKAVPDGWAVVPDDMETENFPFGEAEVNEIGGVMTVTKWIAGAIPEPEPMPEAEPGEVERLRADVDYIAIMTGVDLV